LVHLVLEKFSSVELRRLKACTIKLFTAVIDSVP